MPGTPAPYGYSTPPPPSNFVSREDFDVYRFEAQNASTTDIVKQVRSIAMDGSRVGEFVQYRPGEVDPYGRPVADIYRTYNAIKDHLVREAEHKELEELRKLRQNSPPNHPPPISPFISGVSASQVEGGIDPSTLTTEQMVEKGLIPREWTRFRNSPPKG
jgi:hypothetical protein